MLLPKVPRGLLEIVRARAGGKAPDQLSDVIVGMIDSTAMYGADLVTGFSATQAASAIGTGVTLNSTALTSPGRGLHLAGTVNIGAAAGTQLRMTLGVIHVQGATFHALETTVITAPVVGASYRITYSWPYPHVFLEGCAWQLVTSGDAGGADHTFQLQLLFENYSPLRG